MICPKCKKQITDNILRCNHCGARVATLCKKCNTYNSIYNINCTNCNNALLKICPSCKCVNRPEAKKCRKCGYNFEQKQTEEVISIQEIPLEEPLIKQEAEEEIEIRPMQQDSEVATFEAEPEIRLEAEKVEGEESLEASSVETETTEENAQPQNFDIPIEMYSQQNAKEKIKNGIFSDKRVISLNGEKGVGKSIVLKSAVYELKDKEITWLLGECSAMTQLSPCGLLQDVLLTFFNVTNFCSDSLALKKESQKFFQTEFPTLTNDEIFNLLNLLYPSNTDYFENIFQNKEKTFTLLNKVFKTIIENNKTVFIIENFDLIDGFSYEFLHKLLNTEFKNKPVFLLTYEETRPARGYLYGEKLDNDAYLDISLAKFDKSQTDSFIEQYFPEGCPISVKEQLFANSRGNCAMLEQLVSLLIDFKEKNNSFEITFPPTFNEVIKMRIDFLKENSLEYKILAIAAIQGMKFYPSVINEILKVEESNLIESLNNLQKLNFIMPVNEFSYTFKNSTLWSDTFEIIKKETDFNAMNNSLFLVYSNYILSSNSTMSIISQNLNQNLSALNFWTESVKLAAYIGDTNLYAISQKQCLILIDKLEKDNNSLIKNNIYERLGKLLSKTNPTEAMEYLPNAILNAQKANNLIKEIELTGYMAECCIMLGNYYGIIECIDSIIAKVDSSLDLETAMLKSRKLNALLNIGNSGEIVNLIDNEIMPVFDKYLNAKPHKTISRSSLYKSWLQTYLALANALTFQGDNRSFEILSTLFELFQKNNFDDKLFICKAKLALALANTIKGNIEASEEILGEIIKIYKTDIMDNEAISRWNLINILNNFMHKKYKGIKEELFQVVTFANNINDNFTKNILKTLLGKLLKDQESAKHALKIYEEQITYFSKEKNAIGALLTWYLIAEANLIAEGPEKSLEVSQKALEVAQNPKINNYIFMILYNKVIAEAYIVQSEYELAKMHIERAILIARKFELLNFLADLYLLYGKYIQDLALVKSDNQADYVLSASKMYKRAFLIAQGIKSNYLLERINKAKTVLNSFCQLNGIQLKDE